MELKIDLKRLKESGLSVEEFVYLAIINEGNNPDELLWNTTNFITPLEQNMWIKRVEGGTLLRDKGRQLFEEKNSDIDFDEFWENFPATTSDGRVLRSVNKLWCRVLTKDYIVCKKKYLSKVKNVATHNKIIDVIKARVASGDTKYMSNLETYINGEKWTQDVKYLTMKPKQIDNGSIFTLAGENK